MVICTDKSIVVGSYKVGSRNLETYDRRNEYFCNDLLRVIEGSQLTLSFLSKDNQKNLSEILQSKDSRKIYLLIRNAEDLYTAAIKQSLKNNLTIFPDMYSPKNFLIEGEYSQQEIDEKFESILLDNFGLLHSIFSDKHLTKYLFRDMFDFLNILKINHPGLYDKIVIVNLDDYQRSKSKVLNEDKVLNLEYIDKKLERHSTKSFRLPAFLELKNILNDSWIHRSYSLFFRKYFLDNRKALLNINKYHSNKFI
jgi:hypothetical protein